MRVELLQYEGCPLAPAALQLVRQCLSALGAQEPVLVRIGDYPSPTVLVNGADVMGSAAEPLKARACRAESRPCRRVPARDIAPRSAARPFTLAPVDAYETSAIYPTRSARSPRIRRTYFCAPTARSAGTDVSPSDPHSAQVVRLVDASVHLRLGTGMRSVARADAVASTGDAADLRRRAQLPPTPSAASSTVTTVMTASTPWAPTTATGKCCSAGCSAASRAARPAPAPLAVTLTRAR
jgi:hypothetical protein